MNMSLVSAVVGAQAGMAKLTVATQMERMNADKGASIAKLIDSAQQSIKPLANVAANIGNGLDVSA
jgi:hypothetical protein